MRLSSTKSLLALATVPFLMVLGNSLLIPVLPLLRRALDASLFQVGLLITLFSIPAGLTIPLAGFLSDRFGRKVVMAPAIVLYGLGGLVAGTAAWLAADPYGWIVAGRVLQGIGAGGTYQLAMALTGDIFTSAERAKALGTLEAANGLGKVVSPLAGAAAGLLVWFAPFFVYGLLAFPVAALVWLAVREPRREPQTRSLASYGAGLSELAGEKGRSLLVSFAAGMTVLLLLFGVLSYFSDQLAARYHIRGFGSGLVIAVPVLVMAVTTYVTGVLAQGRTPLQLKRCVSGGLFLAAVAAALFPATRSAVGGTAAVSLLGLGVGLVLSPLNMLVTSAASSRHRGVVTALYGSVRFFGVAAGPPLFSIPGGAGVTGFFLAAGLVTAGIGLAVWLGLESGRLVQEGLGAPQVDEARG